jgi:propionate CoA-transferase
LFTVEHRVVHQRRGRTAQVRQQRVEDHAGARPGRQRAGAHGRLEVRQGGATGLTGQIGVGLPEEVSRLLYEGGMHEDVTFFTETGVVGGLPTPGIFFGAAINPLEIIPSAQVFHRAYEKLDVTILGLLEADSEGNVNVSNRGEGAINYVGPGGFPD